MPNRSFPETKFASASTECFLAWATWSVRPCTPSTATSINPYISVAPRLISGMAVREQRNLYDHVSSFGANVSARITPLPRFLYFLSLHVRDLYHRFASTYGFVNQTIPGGSSNDYSEHRQEYLWGFVGAVNTSFVIASKSIRSVLAWSCSLACQAVS